MLSWGVDRALPGEQLAQAVGGKLEGEAAGNMEKRDIESFTPKLTRTSCPPAVPGSSFDEGLGLQAVWVSVDVLCPSATFQGGTHNDHHG